MNELMNNIYFTYIIIINNEYTLNMYSIKYSYIISEQIII